VTKVNAIRVAIILEAAIKMAGIPTAITLDQIIKALGSRVGKGVVTPNTRPKIMAIGRTTKIMPTTFQIQIQTAPMINQAGVGDKAVIVNRTRAKINSKRAKIQSSTIRRQVETKTTHNNPRNATTTVTLVVTVLPVVRFARKISNHRFRRSSVSKVRPAIFLLSPAIFSVCLVQERKLNFSQIPPRYPAKWPQ